MTKEEIDRLFEFNDLTLGCGKSSFGVDPLLTQGYINEKEHRKLTKIFDLYMTSPGNVYDNSYGMLLVQLVNKILIKHDNNNIKSTNH